jgi:RecA/RadA recombinase
MGIVTEFCGMSGTGKSQLAMMLAINAQIQQGLMSESIFVCTKPFSTKRLVSMIESLQETNPKYIQNANYLDGVHVSYANRLDSFLQILQFGLEPLLLSRNIKLIVVVYYYIIGIGFNHCQFQGQ